MAIDQFFSRDHKNLHVPLQAYRAAACKFLCGLVQPIFKNTDFCVLLEFLSKATRKTTRTFELVPIDQFFVADHENLAAAARKVNATSGQIFRVRDKKLVDWDQIEFSLLCRFAFEARKKQHTNQSLVKIGSTNPHKKLHVPPHAYRAAAAKFLRRKTKK